MKMRKNFKRFAWLLVVILIFSSMPVYATGTDAVAEEGVGDVSTQGEVMAGSMDEADSVEHVEESNPLAVEKEEAVIMEVIEEADNVQGADKAEENETEVTVAPNANKTVASLNEVEINASNFPDTVFREYVSGQFDDDNNGILTLDERAAVTKIDIYDLGSKIKTVDGIGFFADLKELYCAGTSITELNVSNNTRLTSLSCDETAINRLDLSKNVELTILGCTGTAISELDLSNNPKLSLLYCYNNSNISALDVSNNPKLSLLACYNTNISELDISKNSGLGILSIESTSISELDVSNNPELRELYCGDNNISVLNVSDNLKLEALSCNDNSLSKLDIRSNTELIALDCHGNKIKEVMGLEARKEMYRIRLDSNEFTTLPDMTKIAIDLSVVETYKAEKVDFFSFQSNYLTEQELKSKLPAQLQADAQWLQTEITNQKKISSYKVNYVLNGGKNHYSNPSQYAANNAAITLNAPTRTGYKFAGWYSEADYRILCKSIPANSSGDKTFYAKWEALKYTVAFNANSGSVKTKSKAVTYGSAYGALPTPTRSGYKFTGWYTAKTGGSKISGATKVSITKNQTLYAHWAKNYTLTFNANGGSVKTKSKTVTYGGACGTLPTPTRKGYTFAGWYMAKTGGNKINSSTKVSITSNRTAYAHWTANKYTLGFNANGGSVKTQSKTLTYGSTCGTLPTPTRKGYKFTGWYMAKTGGNKINASTRVSITSNRIAYAHWTANKYTLGFNANGGSVKTKSKTLTYGSTCGPLPTPTRKGYKFVGWYMAKTGGNKISSSTKVSITSNRTAYAHWTANKYTLSFNANGGSIKTKSKTVTYGSTCGSLPAPTRKGYKFAGWYMAKTGGNKITASTRVSITSNRTVYAHWKK